MKFLDQHHLVRQRVHEGFRVALNPNVLLCRCLDQKACRRAVLAEWSAVAAHDGGAIAGGPPEVRASDRDRVHSFDLGRSFAALGDVVVVVVN